MIARSPAVRQSPQDPVIRARLASVYLQLGDAAAAKSEACAPRERDRDQGGHATRPASALGTASPEGSPPIRFCSTWRCRLQIRTTLATIRTSQAAPPWRQYQCTPRRPDGRNIFGSHREYSDQSLHARRGLIFGGDTQNISSSPAPVHLPLPLQDPEPASLTLLGPALAGMGLAFAGVGGEVENRTCRSALARSCAAGPRRGSWSSAGAGQAGARHPAVVQRPQRWPVARMARARSRDLLRRGAGGW